MTADAVTIPILSVDDHVIEPPDAYLDRVPAGLVERAPRVVEVDETELTSALGDAFEKWDPELNPVVGKRLTGADTAPRQAWLVDGQLHPLYGMDSCMGRPAEEWGMRPLRFDEMTPGSWDVKARVADMDRAGVYASVNFPAMWVGFCGSTFSGLADKELALALVRAWNSWHLEAWAGAHPDRFVALQLPCLWDPVLAANEIRANAAAGFRAVSFSENPTGQGQPSIHSGHWDPFLAACEETGTVVCLHAGSSGHTLDTSVDAPLEVAQTLFPASAFITAADWVWSQIPVRFPDLRIALSEGGIGWLPLAMDWMDHTARTHRPWTGCWKGIDLLPSEVLRRNFWFCTIEEPLGLQAVASTVGVDHVSMEVDYPHADSSWPASQRILRHCGSSLTQGQLEAVAFANACDLFNYPLPGSR
ncbi:MAG TPA: amidohydrolase family protein [Acidimicrobiales bacterium]|jgi:predicted TIM-barrel fold metal-dependent hydrolase|nr:amidohydrolase family protein [Acidimicrobiales bacterium]